jgi:glycosyltransferase involved in cell wall biosynthesis
VYDSVVRRTLRYCDFYTPTHEVHHEWNTAHECDWLHTFKKDASIHIAKTCDGIISGLYEYDVAYRAAFPDKTTFIPMPIEMVDDERLKFNDNSSFENKIRFFIGINRSRTMLKGTDIMLRALERVAADYPDRCEVVKVESVPFEEYVKLMNGSHVILDQLYSYTPAMNALEAMSRGLIVVGGGEPENYQILNETTLSPIINVEPNEESVYQALKDLALHPERIPQLQRDSMTYIARHHDHVKVAQRYLDFWNKRA